MRKLNPANLKKAAYYLKRNGIRKTVYAALERMKEDETVGYQYQEPSAETLGTQRERVWKYQPLISIVVPAYRTKEEYLVEMAESVMNQTYSRVELVLADATDDDSVERVVRRLMQEDEARQRIGANVAPEVVNSDAGSSADTKKALPGGRIRYIRLAENAGISENTNRGLEAAHGEYIGLLDHDDVLTLDAVYEMADRIEKGMLAGKAPLMLYSDEDKCDRDRTQYYEPHRKMDYDRELLLSNNYICHFLVLERNLFLKLKLRCEYDGAQDYDLVLRAAEQTARMGVPVEHIDKVLYHWRCHAGSTAENPRSKQYAYEAGKRALQDMADRNGWKALALHREHLGFYELKYEPDLMTVRSDIGAVGGRIMSGHRGLAGEKILSGAYNEDGSERYKGMPARFGGYMHRAVLMQEPAAVDIRLIRVRPECRELFRQAVGVPYVEKDGWFDAGILSGRTGSDAVDYRELSMKLAGILRREGYHIVYDPSESVKV